PYAVAILLGLGLDEFSMSATSILKARRMINSLSKKEMEGVAEKALACANSEEVMAYIKSVVDKK
ncbi:MAG: putative PEP-binding protein, partial [Erysipelotrichaceae bacterium]